jgi:hypothetical protein
MFDAVSDGWSKLRFCNFVTINSYGGDEITVESVLANDGVLKSGTYTANFAITNDSEVFYTFTKTFTLDENDLATPIFKESVNLNLPAGKYYFTAELNEASPQATTTHFYVYARTFGDNLNKIFVYNLSNEVLLKLDALKIKYANYNGETNGTLLVGGNDVSIVPTLLNNAKQGLKVIFADGNLFTEDKINAFKDVASDITLKNHRDWLYHKEYILADKQVFNGLGAKMAELARYVDIFPHLSFKTSVTPSDVICPGFLTGFYGAKTSYELNYGMLGFNVGKGKVVLSAFDIFNNLSKPTADILLINLLTKYN